MAKYLYLTATLAAMAALPAWSAAQTTAPASDQAEYDFCPALKAATTIPVAWKSTSVLKGAMSNGRAPEYFDLTMAAEMAVTVEKFLPDGKTQGRLVINRLSGAARRGQAVLAFDSQSPQTLLAEDGKPSYITCLCRQSYPLSLDKSLKLVAMEIPAGLGEGCAKAFAEQAEAAAYTQAVTQWVQALAAEPYAYLPMAAVKPGQTWQARKKVAYIDYTGLPVIIEEISDCTLLKVVASARGRVAQVEIAGKCMLPGKDKETQLAEYDVTGAMRVNLDDPTSLRWRVQLVARLKDKDNKDALSHTITTETMAGREAQAATQSVSAPAR